MKTKQKTTKSKMIVRADAKGTGDFPGAGIGCRNDGRGWSVIERETGNVLISGESYESAKQFAAMWDR